MLRNRYLLVVVAPLVLGLLILASFPTLVKEAAYANEKGKALAAREVLTSDQLKVATSLSTAFEKVAQAVEPSVVTVVSVKKPRVAARHQRRRMQPEPQENQMVLDCVDELLHDIDLNEPRPTSLASPAMGKYEGELLPEELAGESSL